MESSQDSNSRKWGRYGEWVCVHACVCMHACACMYVSACVWYRCFNKNSNI